MDHYSHRKYHSPMRRENSFNLKRIFLVLMIIALIAGGAFYLYKTGRFTRLKQTADNMIEAKNEPAPIHFEFYTALANNQVGQQHQFAEDKPKRLADEVQVASHEELEKDMSSMMNQKGKEE